MKVDIHIERLSVEGMTGGGGSAAELQAALVNELSRIIQSDAGFVAGLSTARRSSLDCKQPANGGSPSALGAGAAGALHAALSSSLNGEGQAR